MAVWMAVALAPVALFALRLIDDSAVALLVPSALALMIVLFLVVMGAAVRAAAGASLPRALAGAGGALLAVVLLTLPMSHVIGQRACPERMGVDRGVQVSSQMLDAWRNGERPSVAVWNDLGVADAWRTQIAGLRLIDYKLEDSGCWERLAPVTTTRTWHQFRVTVQRGDGERFSKVVTVHTRAARDGWRVAEIEGLEL